MVEIDAASHNGVDDARELRERAVFAPSRDRYKIFILDEAHMVTPQGFNALLKIVEEPPEHVKFIFATTEPEKVIGTIRSRTHHYPFRLVPPAELLEYLASVLESEGYAAADGVLPMVVRASGGSVRDALSLLDQLIAGSDGKTVEYDRSINLLGFTHDNLMSEVVEAFAELDAAKAFAAVDKVIQSGQDARRFLEDLLERIRDLMLINTLGNDAKAILRGIGPQQFDLLAVQAARFGLGQLTTTAEAAAKALSDTSAASNPRLQLELMCARVLAPVSQDSIKRAQAEPVVEAEPAKSENPTPGQSSPEPRGQTKIEKAPAAEVAEENTAPKSPQRAPKAEAPVTTADAVPPQDVTTAFFKGNWQSILDSLSKQSRSAWAVAFTTKVLDFDGDVLTLLFQSQKDVDAFKNSGGAADVLRQVIREISGVSVKYRAKVADAPTKVTPAPAVEPNPDEFSEPEEVAQDQETEAKTEPITQPETGQSGEYLLRNVLGAQPLKGES